MEELKRLDRKRTRLTIGLMSGTSLDGIDIALVEIAGSGQDIAFELKEFHTFPMPSDFRKRIRKAFSANVEEICRLNFDLGSLFADLVLDFCATQKVPIENIDLIGSHGQTVYHIHNHSTLQIGEADLIARKTGTVVVSDFRAADIAVGGCGAPLVPYFDRILFRTIPGSLALQNLGGIGNVTYLPEDRSRPIIAFDTGPANAILNELTEIATNGQANYDKDGFLSQQGTCRSAILKTLRTHPYFTLKLPKTTGREEFGRHYVEKLMHDYPKTSLPDLLRTCLSLVSRSIADAYRRYLPLVDRIILSGGGTRHPLLFQEIKENLHETEVEPLDTVCPINPDAKEAVAFALLAHEKINQSPTNLPSVTRARQLVSLGKISVP